MNNIDDIINTLLSIAGKDDNKNEADNSDDLFGGIDIDMILKLGDIMTKLNENDINTELLTALKPYLREENKSKIDTAIKLIRLISVLPLLKDSGLFDNIL